MRWIASAVLLVVLIPVVACATPASEGLRTTTPPPQAQLVSFPGPDAGTEMHGFLYVPPGKGPFPAILWNHGSEKFPGWQPDLARFYNGQGFEFFIPHRRGQGQSPGPYIMDRVRDIRGAATSAAEGGKMFVALHEEASRDVDAALAWLKRRPEVDPNRIVMSGLSFGGIQTVLAAERGLGVRAFVAFAPGAMSWAKVPALGERLQRAARGAKAPLLVVQAANDFDLAPTRVLGQELAHRTDQSATRVYPAFGSSAPDGHGGFATRPEGIALWGPDVVSFLKKALASAR